LNNSKPPLCTVLVLNYNGLDFIKRFCQGWVDHLPDHTVLVIADNASTDYSIDYLKQNFSEVEIITLDKNHGFAAGYNHALKEVNTKYCILLNSDVEIKSAWVEPLVEMLEQDDSIAAVQPKILAQQTPDSFEYAGAAGGYLDRLAYPFCRGRIFQSVEKDLQQYNTPTEIFWASGAAIALRTQLYKDVGGFDADFFAHMEEIDLCWRFKRLGLKVMYQPKSSIYHVGGGTLSYASSRKTFLNFRNSLLMILKNEESGQVFSVIFQRMLLDGVAALSFLPKGQVGSFIAVFRAHLAFYGLLGKFRKKRSQLLTSGKASKANNAGRISKSIVLLHFLKGVKHFNQIKE